MDDNTLFRTCTQCGQSFPATDEYFYKIQGGRYLASWCKPCHLAWNNKRLAERRTTDLELIKKQTEYKTQYRKDHHEQISAYNKAKYRADPKAEVARVRANDKRFEERRKRYRKEYNNRSEVKERLRKQSHDSYQKRVANEESRLRIQTWRRNRKARIRNAPGTHTTADIQALYEEQNGLCAYCGIRLFDTYHVDHVMPLSRGGGNDIDNILLTCPDCNLSKSNKTLAEWQAMRGW